MPTGQQCQETPRPNCSAPGEAPTQRRPSPLSKAPLPVTAGLSVTWNPHHALMLSSFCRRGSLSQADRGSPRLCFTQKEPHSRRGTCGRSGGTFFSFSKRDPWPSGLNLTQVPEGMGLWRRPFIFYFWLSLWYEWEKKDPQWSLQPLG